MDFIIAKGSGIYDGGEVTLMATTTIVDVMGTQMRYDDTVKKARKQYHDGDITLAERDKLIEAAEWERLHLPLTTRISNQSKLDKVRAKEVGYKEEQGCIRDYETLDFETGIEDNTFEIQINKLNSMLQGIALGDYIFAEGTEFGGIIDGRTIDTASDVITWTGTTWRGLLESDIIRPNNPSINAFRIVNGDANDILREILTENASAGSFFTVPTTSAGVTLTNYQFPRYVKKLRGLKDMLASVGYRLQITAKSGGAGGTFSVEIGAVPIINYSQEIEYSQDTNRIDVKMTQDYSVCNHLICLGAGELTARQVVDFYIDKNGTITQTRPASNGFLGINERIEIYDYSSVEGETTAEKLKNLKIAGISKLLELNEVDTMELTVEDISAEIGDIVSGLDRTTGVSMQKAITNKILRVDATGAETIELKVDGKEEDINELN